MNANTGILIGLGVVGALIIVYMGGGEQPKKKILETQKPNVEPKKIQL
jgi:hypothetical protein